MIWKNFQKFFKKKRKDQRKVIKFMLSKEENISKNKTLIINVIVDDNKTVSLKEIFNAILHVCMYTYMCLCVYVDFK